jgi:hypothetical protein
MPNQILEDPQDSILHLVIYIITEDCWLGLFHIWQDDDQILITCSPDIAIFSGWLKPIRLTLKNIDHLLKTQKIDELSYAILLYHGSEMPDYAISRNQHPPFFSNVVFCQEIEELPETAELGSMVIDFFNFS